MFEESIRITELPPGIWTNVVIEKLLEKGFDVTKNGTDEKVDFTVSTTTVPKFMEKKFSERNMHLIGESGHIKKFKTKREIFYDYFAFGQTIYERSLRKKIEDLRCQFNQNQRRKTYIELFLNNEIRSTLQWPLELTQLQVLMEERGFPEDISDLLNNVTDREKTAAGAERCHRRAEDARTALDTWRVYTWRDMWKMDLASFKSSFTAYCETHPEF